jgi:beta-mannosidase
MANRRLLERLIPAGERWPADRTNPVYRHLGEWWNNAPFVQESFRHRLGDLESLRRASQLLQATGLAYAVEANRRHWPRRAIVLPWQLAESYPNAWCTSSVDHRGEPKPAYYAVTRAFARRRVTVRVPTAVWGGARELSAEVWLWDEDESPAGGQVHARLRASDGEVLAEAGWPVRDVVRNPRAVGTVIVDAASVPADAVVVWDVSWSDADGIELDREIVLAATGDDFAPLLDLVPATLDVEVEDGAVQVTHRGGPLVVGLQLIDDGPIDEPCRLVVSGDPRPLLPGERRTFAVHAGGRAVLESWNSDPVSLQIKESSA